MGAFYWGDRKAKRKDDNAGKKSESISLQMAMAKTVLGLLLWPLRGCKVAQL
jgi:hypothetical protein